jgi:O-antigen biosynthesis protein
MKNESNESKHFLRWTGERFLPWIEGAQIHYEHLHRYAFAAQFVKGKKVLDLGSGEGYGSYLLSKEADFVLGLDIDEQSINHANGRYHRDNLQFVQGSFLEVPIKGQKEFDVVICFEALEHITEHHKLVSEVKRLLKDDGLLIASTPNKETYTDELEYHNTFHLKELYFDEFKKLLHSYFNNMKFIGQRVHVGSNLWPLFDDKPSIYKEFIVRKEKEEFKFTDPSGKKSLYIIAIASNVSLDEINPLNSSLIDVSETLLNEKDSVTNELNKVLQAKNAEIEQLHNVIEQIKNGLIMRLAAKFKRMILKVTPPGTLGNRFGHLLLRGIRIIANEGWKSFWRRFINRSGIQKFLPFMKSTYTESYSEWITANEPSPADLEKQKSQSSQLKYMPKISIIMPTWNTEKKSLVAAIESVVSQTYANWELCIADGGSLKKHVKELLTRYAKKDARIKVKFLQENKGISGNSNEALSLTEGEFVGLLDHDDTITPFALFEIVKLLNEKPEADLIYSDEDKINQDSDNRFAPFFKPDWSPELLISCNYVTHFTVIRKKLIVEANGFKTEMDGAQDWDLFLKISERTNNIFHIPKILYHWRASDKSCSLNTFNKNYAIDAQIKALQSHFKRCQVQASVSSSSSGAIKINWNTMSEIKLSIIIPTKDNVSLLRNCISSLLTKNTYKNFEIIIIDSGSKERETFEYYDEICANEMIKVIKYNQSIFNYSAANNFGAKQATGDAFLFLNNDTEIIEPDSLKEMVGWASIKRIGIVGAKLLKPDGQIQHAGVIIGLGGFAGEIFAGARGGEWTPFGSTEWYRNYSAVTGACMMIRRDVFEEIKGFDEELTLCGNDVELCLRAWKSGYRVVMTPYAKLMHVGGITRGSYITPENYFASYKHYKPFLQSGDPYYNPNLSYKESIPQIRDSKEESPLRVVEKYLLQIGGGREPDQSCTSHAPGLTETSSNHLATVNLVEEFDFSDKEFYLSKKLMSQHKGQIDLETINWFIPDFNNPYWGGIRTILQFADYFKKVKGVSNNFIVCGAASKQKIQSLLDHAFPALSDQKIQILNNTSSVSKIDSADASIATLWTTAYPLLKFNKTKRKFYFIQDYEPSFYAAGSTYGQAEETYRFGFYGICNTISLKNSYENYYSGKAEFFTPCVDTKLFYPSDKHTKETNFKVFFYARPGHPRNAFELGITALHKLKNAMGSKVKIVTAGADWKPCNYGLEGIVENLGLLDYQETANLYRQCDLGLIMMFTRHPSYIPFELMASGCLVVSNFNESTTWFLKDKSNCVLTHASASAIGDSMVQILNDHEERIRITTNALRLIKNHYSNWEMEMDKIFNYMREPDKPL